MAQRGNYRTEKRRKELARLKKQESKRKRRLNLPSEEEAESGNDNPTKPAEENGDKPSSA